MKFCSGKLLAFICVVKYSLKNNIAENIRDIILSLFLYQRYAFWSVLGGQYVNKIFKIFNLVTDLIQALD